MNHSAWPIRSAAIVTFFYIILLLWAFLTPVANLPDVPKISDYIWHIGLLAVLVIPLMAILPKHITKIAVAAIAFGTIVEFIQPSFGRGFEIHDLLSNILGVGAGLFISRFIAASFKPN